MKNNLVESLEAFFKAHSKEEIKAIWDSGNYLDNEGGYKVVDWLRDNNSPLLEDLNKSDSEEESM